MASPSHDHTTAQQGYGQYPSFEHTVSGSNRLLLVFVGLSNNTTSVSYGSYNSIDLVFHGAQNSLASRIECWKLLDPPAGVYSLDMALSAAAGWVVAGVSLNGVNQSTPFNGTYTSDSGESYSPSITVASASDEAVVEGFASYCFTGMTGDMVAEENRTQRWSLKTDGTILCGGSTTIPGLASSVCDWSLTDAPKWASLGVSVKGVIESAILHRLALLGVG